MITLGIIGVVAALTMPILVSKYEKRVIETGLKKTYSELQNVIRMAENEYGSFSSWDHSLRTDQFVKKYFVPYMHLTLCDKYHGGGSKCFVNEKSNNNVTWYTPTETSKRGAVQSVNSNFYSYLLDDGRAIMFYSEYYANWSEPGYALTIFVDVNGKRGRTVMGQDVFAFSLCNFRGIKGRLKVGPAASWSENHTSDYLVENCIKSIPYVVFKGSACGLLLERNGWHFPDNYPIKF